MSNAVNHPSHYNSGKIEVIEAIEDWKVNFHRGNAIKYIARAGKKDPAKTAEDLEKAVWYLRREIELLTAKEPRRPNDMNPRDSVERGLYDLPPSMGIDRGGKDQTEYLIGGQPVTKEQFEKVAEILR